ncbi:MAG: hypothetical protein ACC726_14615, partial [Chloroflexota bacterium]
MRNTRRSGFAFALAVSTAVALTSTGVVLGQEESPTPEASMAAEASPAPEVVEPSTLSILQVATHKTAGTKLKGKKYAKAIVKAAPKAVGYLITTAGADDIDRIIKPSRTARAVDEAGDAKAAKALIDIATLLYRNEWTRTKSDPVALNLAIQEAVATAGLDGDPALVHADLWGRFIDVCVDQGGGWFYNPLTPSLCEDEGGRMVRADFTGINPEGATEADIDLVDAGGIGIHKIVQDKTANDKLAGKKYKKALAKTLKKSGPAVAGYYAGGGGAGRMNGVIDLVLLAREADEAGNAKAAKAFMALALAAFREGLTSWEQTPREFVTALDELGQTTYQGQPGVALLPPDGFELICLNEK